MASFLDVCRFVPTAGGTTDWTYSAAVVGYQSPTAAGAINGAVYRYRAESADLSQWEIGFGAYNSATGVFSRTTILFNSSGGTSKITFSTVPQVAIVALAEDLTVTTAAAKSDQQAGTSAVLAVTPSQQHQHDSAAKAWVSFLGQGTNGACTIQSSYNVSGVSRTGTGVYVVTFTVPFAAATYSGICSALSGAGGVTAQNNAAKSASSYSIGVFASGVATDPAGVDTVFFGRQ